MADTAISALADGSPLGASDRLVVARSGQNYKVAPPTLAQIASIAPAVSAISANSQKITSLGTPTTGTDAATKAYVDAAVVAGTTPTLATVLSVGNDAGGAAIVNLGTPALETDASTKGYVDAVEYNSRTGTTYILVYPDDMGVCISANNVAGLAVTVPTFATAAFPLGTVINFRQNGAGAVTFAGAGGVTIGSRGGLTSTAGANAWATLIKSGTNQWDLIGDLA